MFATRRVFASVVKRSTGIVGLDAVPNARSVLVQLYEKTLQDVQVRNRCASAVCCRQLRERAVVDRSCPTTWSTARQ